VVTAEDDGAKVEEGGSHQIRTTTPPVCRRRPAAAVSGTTTSSIVAISNVGMSNFVGINRSLGDLSFTYMYIKGIDARRRC